MFFFRRPLIAIIVLALCTPVPGHAASNAAGGQKSQAALAPVARFWTEVWQGGDVALIDDLMTEDFVIHSAGSPIGPRARFKAWVASFFENIADLELEIHDMFSDGTMVASRWTCRGRLTGTMFGVAGTGQPIVFTGINVMRVEDGRIVEAWIERDGLGIARSLGVLD